MPRALPVPPPGFDDLPVEEKVQYVEALWNRIAAAPEEVGVPEWHRQLLRERLVEYRSDPSASRPWGEVRDAILHELAGRKPPAGS
jgi:putative addiction module component (TIGR02574 family)